MADLIMKEHRASLLDTAIFPSQIPQYNSSSVEIRIPKFYESNAGSADLVGCSAVNVVTDDGPMVLVFQIDTNNSYVEVDYDGGENFTFSKMRNASWAGLTIPGSFHPSTYVRVWNLDPKGLRDSTVRTPVPVFQTGNNLGQVKTISPSTTPPDDVKGYLPQYYNLPVILDTNTARPGNGSGDMSVYVTNADELGAPIEWSVFNPGRGYAVGDTLVTSNLAFTGEWTVVSLYD